MSIKAAVVEVCITPPIGVELGGYGPHRQRYSTRIQDHHEGQALVLDDGRERAVFITADLLNVTEAFTGSVRERIAQATDISPSHIMVSSTHSHTAPPTGVSRGWGSADEGYVEIAARHLAGAAISASQDLVPVQISVGRSEHRDLAWNRTGHDTIDPTVDVLRINALDGTVIAIHVVYACHPVTLGPTTEISADYPGALRRHLKERYPDAIVLFANGTSGDIDPVTHRAAWGSGNYDDVVRLSRALADDVAQAVTSAKPIDDPELSFSSQTVEIAYSLPSTESLQERIHRSRAEVASSSDADGDFGAPTDEARMPEYWLQYYEDLARRIATGQEPDVVHAELQAIAVGPGHVFVAIPGEVYAEHGVSLRREFENIGVVPVTHANGSFGYFPPRREFETSGYTALLAAAVQDRPPYQANVADQLMRAARKLVASCV